MRKQIRILLYVILIGVYSTLTHAAPKDECQKLIDAAFRYRDTENFPKALEYFTSAQLLAEKNHSYDQLFTIKNNIGVIYFRLLDYGEALNFYLQAYSIAIRHLSPKREMTVLNNIAALYSSERNYVKGNEYFKRAYDIAHKVNDSAKIGLYAVNLGRVANMTNNITAGKQYLEEALRVIGDDANLLLKAKIDYAYNIVLSGNSKEGIKLLSELAPQTDAGANGNDRVDVYSHLAHAYYNEKQFGQAIRYINDALKSNADLRSRISLYDKLSEIYLLQNEFHLALQMKDSVMKAKDSLSIINNGQLLENNKVKFEIQDYKNELKVRERQLAIERKIFFSSAIFFIIVLYFIYRLWKSRAEKLEQKRVIAETEQKVAELQLEQQKYAHLTLEKHLQNVESEALLEQGKLKDEIEQKNKKLSARALYLSGRNEMIENIVTSLLVVPDISKNETLKNSIRLLKEHLKSDSEWELFIAHFEEVNQGLLRALKEKHPALTSNDIRFLCYVYMNLSTKEVCSVFNITPEACRKRKERIARKLGLVDSTGLYNYISDTRIAV